MATHGSANADPGQNFHEQGNAKFDLLDVDAGAEFIRYEFTLGMFRPIGSRTILGFISTRVWTVHAQLPVNIF